MRLTQAERIQVLRRRANLNQGDFGAQAFNTSYESGRTKVKNIELGKQIPTAADVVKMSAVLGVAENELRESSQEETGAIFLEKGDTVIHGEVLGLFPGLETYLDMLNKAVCIGDTELIGHIAEKTAAIFSGYAKESSPGVAIGSKA